MINHPLTAELLNTNREGGICPIRQTASEAGSTIIVDLVKCYGSAPGDFDRIEFEAQYSKRWLVIAYDKIRKGRIYQASCSIDKAQAKLLLNTLATLVEKMED